MSTTNTAVTTAGLGKRAAIADQEVADGSHYPLVVYLVREDAKAPYHIIDRRNNRTLAICTTLQDAHDAMGVK